MTDAEHKNSYYFVCSNNMKSDIIKSAKIEMQKTEKMILERK